MKTKILYITIIFLSISMVINSCTKNNNTNPVSVIVDEETQSIEISWQTKAAMPDARYCGDAIVCNDMIYHIGGRSSISIERSNFEYDPILDSWNTKAVMQRATMKLALAAIGDNIYAIGGDRFLSKNEIYNTLSNTWTYGASMPTRRQHVDCGVVNGKIYVIGGLLSWDAFTGINEAYDPATNTWETKAPMPTPRHNPAITVYEDKIYVFGGSGSTTDIWAFQNTVEVYDPATDTWVSKQGLPTNRFKPATAVIDDKIYISSEAL